jgi:deferrochelatase/peroxidase EfeB
MDKLETNDIQHFLLARTPALAARYEFLSFRNPAAGCAWLSGLVDKVGTADSVGANSPDSRWVTLAFTWKGLRALGLDEASLASFPEEFKQGLAARAEILGITGANHPDQWLGKLADPELHAIAILFASDVPERERCRKEHAHFIEQIDGVEVVSSLDLEAIPPFTHAHEHFGYRDRLSHPLIEGIDAAGTSGWETPTKAGEFFIGYVDESGYVPVAPTPEVLSRNGSYIAYLRMDEHVGAFRDFLRSNGKTRDEQELVAAKLMGRWRSGAPLVLAPDKDNPALAGDKERTNAFDYGKMDPYGYACPVGSHMRRMNPRDTAESMERHKMIRRGGTYGPALPEGVPDDGVERGIAAFVGCASLVRQFEFAMNVWVNDPNFKELGNERDPFVGTQDGSFDYTIPKRPIKKKVKGLPAFTTIRGGAYFFLPGIRALRFLAAGCPIAQHSS